MLWYLLKTWAGREEEMVKEIHRTVPPYMYNEAFVIYNERIWRRQGNSILHREPLFKGCVFLTCGETEPLFRRMARVPSMAMLMATGNLSVFPLMERDAGFLENISGKDHVVRVSYLLREDDGREAASFYRVSGPLAGCLTDITGFEFRKRFVKIEKRLWGEDKTIAFGVLLNEDIERPSTGGCAEFPAPATEPSSLLEIRRDAEGRRSCREIRSLGVQRGEYEEMVRVG